MTLNITYSNFIYNITYYLYYYLITIYESLTIVYILITYIIKK